MAMAQIMTAKEVAEYLRLQPITIYRYAGKGKIPATRVGRFWRFDKDAIDRWIAGDKISPRTGKAAKRKTARKPKK